MHRPLLALLTISLALASCSAFEGEQSDLPLQGTEWVLHTVRTTEGEAQSVTSGAYRITFGEAGAARGRAACNECEGSYTASGEAINVEVACTRIACPDDSFGAAFHSGLLGAERYEVRGTELELGGAFGELRLRGK